MKKILTILIIAIATLLANNIVSAQTENVKPASRVGGTIGVQLPEMRDVGIGLNAFFYQAISKRWFLSFNVGCRYSYSENAYFFRTEEHLFSIPMSAGANVFLSLKEARPYLGLELGFLKNLESYPSLETIIVPVVGLSISVSKNISLEINTRIEWGYSTNVGLNIGAAYLIP